MELKLYVAVCSVDCEPGYLIGVYTTEKLAREALSRVKGHVDGKHVIPVVVDRDEHITV